MSSLAVPSFPPATMLAQHRAAAAVVEVAPWRGILAVEPDIAVLHTGSLLLTKANYSVTPATSDHELFTLRRTKVFALAILSDRLGQRLLGAAAEAVRRHWPRTRILILGRPPALLEDYLYDQQIHRSPDPRQVLDDLEDLYKGMWNQRSNTLDWNATRSARAFARAPMIESEPTRRALRASTQLKDPCDSTSHSRNH